MLVVCFFAFFWLLEAVDWKKRKCLLTGESLSLFSDPKDIEPSQIVFLNGATAEAELGEVRGVRWLGLAWLGLAWLGLAWLEFGLSVA